MYIEGQCQCNGNLLIKKEKIEREKKTKRRKKHTYYHNI